MILFFLNALVTLNSSHKVPIVLSSTDMNRLALKNGRIASVYGTDIFNVEIDEKLGQVFLYIKSGIPVPDRLSMAFTTEDCMTQDLLVTFKEGVSKPIVFDTKPIQSSLRQKAHRFFYQVLSEQTDDFVTQTNGQNQDLHWCDLIFQKRIVSKEFSVEFFQINSKRKNCTYNLNQRFFLSPGVCGVWLSDNQLSHSKSVTIAKLRRRT